MPLSQQGSSVSRCQSSSWEPLGSGPKYIQIAADHPAAEQYHNLLPHLLPYLCQFQKFITTLVLVESPNNPRKPPIPTIIIGLSVPENDLSANNKIFQDLCGPLHVEVLHILEGTHSPETEHTSESTYQTDLLAPGASKDTPTNATTLVDYLRDRDTVIQRVMAHTPTWITPISSPSHGFGTYPSRCPPVPATAVVTQSSRVHRAHEIARLEREMQLILEELDVNLPERHTANSAADRWKPTIQKLMELRNAEFNDCYLHHIQGHDNCFSKPSQFKGLATASCGDTHGEEFTIPSDKMLELLPPLNGYSSETSPSTARILEKPSRRLYNSTLNGIRATTNEGELVATTPCGIVDELPSCNWRMQQNIIVLGKTHGAISQHLLIKLVREGEARACKGPPSLL